MISAYTFKQAQDALYSAQSQVQSEAPAADFVFVGLDEENIYFNVVAKPHDITQQQKIDLQEKTRFALLRETDNTFIYKAEFAMAI